MNEAFATPIICSGRRGIGDDFWRRYTGPSEKMPDGARCTVPIQRHAVKTTSHCVDCGATIVRCRDRMVRCRPCQDRRTHELRLLSDARTRMRRRPLDAT